VLAVAKKFTLLKGMGSFLFNTVSYYYAYLELTGFLSSWVKLDTD
jgi:hypothetical protein